jgi:hypothetical protein
VAKTKKSKQDRQAKEAAQATKADAKAKAKAAARLAMLVDAATKASKTAEKAVKAAAKAQADAVAAGAPAPKAKASEADLLKLALRGAEAKLTDAERKVEALEQQIAGFHRRDLQELEDVVEEAILEAAVEATVGQVIEAELAVAASDAAEAEAIAEQLDEIITEVDTSPDEPAHDGDAAEAAQVFAASDAGAEPTVTTSELTPPLPEGPAAEEPSGSWTLLQLRAEAKRRGLAGTSNLPKAALLQRLRD